METKPLTFKDVLDHLTQHVKDGILDKETAYRMAYMAVRNISEFHIKKVMAGIQRALDAEMDDFIDEIGAERVAESPALRHEMETAWFAMAIKAMFPYGPIPEDEPQALSSFIDSCLQTAKWAGWAGNGEVKHSEK